MHFKRNLWLSFTGATIIIVAVLFGSHSSEASSDAHNSGSQEHASQKSLPQMNQLKKNHDTQKTRRDPNAQGSNFIH